MLPRMALSGPFVGAVAGLALLGGGTAQAAELPPADRQFVDATVMQAMQSGRLPGVSLKLTGPKGDYIKTYGVSDLATQKPMALDDHVRIASITKSFTATAVLRQVQRGRLELSDKLDRWVKGIRYGKRITVRQMLAMRSASTTSPATRRRSPLRGESAAALEARRRRADHPRQSAAVPARTRRQSTRTPTTSCSASSWRRSPVARRSR